jgi:hypothetical protein
MIIFNVVRSNTALTASTATGFLNLVSGATRSYGILEIDAEGAGTASAYMEIGVYRVTTAGTAGTAVTPTPVNAASSAPSFTANGGATGQTVGALISTIPVNANGQRYFWRAMPNLSNAIWAPGGATAAGQVSFASTAASGSATLRVQVGEI